MFRTKQEVDRHVNNSLRKLNNETERCLRSFSFAKLYFNVGDYEHAVRYLTAYLSIKPKAAEGHNLLGKSLEKLGKRQAALEAFRTSLQLDSMQNNLVLKVCELLAEEDVTMESSGAKYFCDLAQRIDPHNPCVVNLKEKLITNKSQDPNEVVNFLLKELENRPTDVNLRVRLLKHLLENNNIKEAYKHASEIEEKKLSLFDDSISWYETFAEVLVRYQKDASISTQLTWEFWFLSTSVLEKLAMLSLNDHHTENVKTSTDYTSAVFNFDQSLLKSSKSVSQCPDKILLKEFLNHYEAQLYLHLSVLALKQAKKDLITFKEVQNIILPLLFTAYNLPIPDTQGVWFNNLPENRRLLVIGWHKEAAFRCSQAGNILLALSKDFKDVIVEKGNQYSSGMWRENLFKKIFVKRDQQLKINTSFFSNSSLEIIIRLPNYKDLITYNEVAQLMYPGSLHHHIWLCLNYINISDFTLKSFDGLPYSVKNLSNCSAESLNILDVQSFIYCATLCAQSKLKNADPAIRYFAQNRPPVLPVSITTNLGTVNQAKFLQSAYKMYKNEFTTNMAEIRMTLIKGIEVIRCVGNHGLDVKLLVILATTFADRANKLSIHSEIESNSARAELYWKTSLPLLEKLQNEHALIYPNNRLFEYKNNKELTQYEIARYIEDAKLFMGSQFMKKEEYEKAMNIFQGLRSPYASFYQAQIYKNMADAKTNQLKENVTSEMRSQNIILLSRARDCLYLTLDRLREPSQDRNHPLNAILGTEIEKTERLLSRIDPDCANNRNLYEGISDENGSDDSVGDHFLTTYSHHASFPTGRDFSCKGDPLQMHSTPLKFGISKREAKPSPERLDAQIRQLMSSKDVAINGILEQNKMMVEIQQSLTDEIRGFKDAVKNLSAISQQQAHGNIEDVRSMVDDMGKKIVTELSVSVDSRLDNLTDMVLEIRRELNDMKKDEPKTNSQLNVDDLYDLDSEYNNLDYNNLGAGIPQPTNINPMLSNWYSYSGNRGTAPPPALPPPSSLAPYGGNPPIFPGLFPGLPFPFGTVGMPQPGALPSFLQQQAEQMAQNSANIPGLYPATLNANIHHQPPPPPTQNNHDSPSSRPSFTNSALNFTPPAISFSNQNNSSIHQQPKENPRTSAAPTAPLFGPNLNPPSSSSSISTKAPPVNVVITSSDPLPALKSSAQPVLSVTIPPQHIKGNVQKQPPHNFQIPINSSHTICTNPSVLSEPSPSFCTQSILSSISSPAVSVLAKNPTSSVSPNVSLGVQIEKVLDKTFSSPNITNNSNISNSSNVSLTEYDPRPDFQPIIPLPDEVPVTTGEENEMEIVALRGKLYRFDVKEWKERGVGLIKILFNSETGKVRILMRREIVHKICANHFINQDMKLGRMQNSDCAFTWAALDFAEEQVKLEKFCVRFKTADEAKRFSDAFDTGKSKIRAPAAAAAAPAATPQKISTNIFDTKPAAAVTPTSTTPSTSNLGGFKFMNTPTFVPKENPALQIEKIIKEPAPASPFAGFTFGAKAADSPKNIFATKTTSPATFSSTPQQQQQKISEEDDFVPTAEFKPVVEKLPELVDVKTGEENSAILFDERCKLYRMDKSSGKCEWKERGLGNIKILKDSMLRLLMRREQVHKVCLNHQILKNNMPFKKNLQDSKTVTWLAKDFSEGSIKEESFSARFKFEEQAEKFINIIENEQKLLDESNKVKGTPTTPDKLRTPSSVQDKWKCKNCFSFNKSKTNQCETCDTVKPGSAKKLEPASISFSVKPLNASDQKKTEFSITPSGFGDKFKPAANSWECKSCYGRNDADKMKCIACEAPKEGSASPSTQSTLKGISLDTGGQTFTFGMTPVTPSATAQKPEQQLLKKSSIKVPQSMETKNDSNAVLSGFGDSFKPKPGSWDCKSCYTRNEPPCLYCLSCEAPKDDSVPKKEAKSSQGVNLETPGVKFSFGMAAATAASSATSSFAFGDSNNKPFSQIPFSWTPAATAAESVKKPVEPSLNSEKSATDNENFYFGSPQKHDFEFKPRSPRKSSTGQGDESDVSYAEEEEANVSFKPIIPLPDIVEVKTGEENEEVIYSHRAKLYRFIKGEWKERGLGDLKILKDIASRKLRVIMRREQVLKICLNHLLTKTIQYSPRDEKSWCFNAPDYSEGDLNCDTFCLRFKNEEIAKEFKSAVDNALAEDEQEAKTAKENVITNDDSEEVEFVTETEVTPEEEKEALRLGLPPKFMAYRQRADCECEQCKKDDEYLSELFKNKDNQANNKITPSSFTINMNNSSSFFTPSSSFSVSSNTSTSPHFSFTTPTATGNDSAAPAQRSDILRELLQKTVICNPSSVSAAAAETSGVTITPVSSASSVLSANTPKTDDEKASTLANNNFSSLSSGFNFSERDNNNHRSPLQKSNSSNMLNQKSDNIFKINSDTKLQTFGGGPVNIFGNSNDTGSTSNIFSTNSGSTLSVSSANSSFGNLNLFSTSSATSLFGNSTGSSSDKSKNIFENSSQTKFSGTNIFQNANNSTNFFGSSSQGSIFGNTPTSNAGSLFSGQIFGNKGEPKVTDANLSFGGGSDTSVPPKEILKESVETVLKSDPGLSFANLASKVVSENDNIFVTPQSAQQSETANPFAFLGAGAPVFGAAAASAVAKPNNKEKLNKTVEESAADDNNDEESSENDPDPHFEPIIPLPDKIVVTTGEEEETAIFSERAKLYRYDATGKEWKERGVGQLKVLFHPINLTYRLLLRRDQVHKIVLNQRITTTLTLNAMGTAENAWIWYGLNHIENESKMEQFAIRLKSSENAKKFKLTIDEITQKLAELNQSSDNNIPTTIKNLGEVEDVSTEDGSQHDDDDDEEEERAEDDDDDDDEDDDSAIMFTKRCTLSEQLGDNNWQLIGSGLLQVFYDPELSLLRVHIVGDNSEILSNTIIGPNTQMTLNDKECCWTAEEWADAESGNVFMRTLKVRFSSKVAAEEFHSNYLDGINIALEIEIPYNPYSAEVDGRNDDAETSPNN